MHPLPLTDTLEEEPANQPTLVLLLSLLLSLLLTFASDWATLGDIGRQAHSPRRRRPRSSSFVLVRPRVSEPVRAGPFAGLNASTPPSIVAIVGIVGMEHGACASG